MGAASESIASPKAGARRSHLAQQGDASPRHPRVGGPPDVTQSKGSVGAQLILVHKNAAWGAGYAPALWQWSICEGRRHGAIRRVCVRIIRLAICDSPETLIHYPPTPTLQSLTHEGCSVANAATMRDVRMAVFQEGVKLLVWPNG